MIKLQCKLSIILSLYHTVFAATDAVTVNIGRIDLVWFGFRAYQPLQVV